MPEAGIRYEFDLARRALPGTTAYFVALGLSLAMTPLVSDHPLAALTLAAGILLSSVIRILIIIRQAWFYPKYRRAWNQLFNLTSILVAVFWGSLAATHFVYYGVRVNTVILLLFVCGAAAGAVTSLHARLWLARSYLVLLILPSLTVNIWVGHKDPFWTSGYLIIFLVYLWFQVKQLHRDYWDSINNRQDAQRERDKLSASEERFRYVLEASRVGVWQRDLTTGAMYYSETLQRICGISLSKTRPTRRTLLDCLHPEDRLRVNQELRALGRKSPNWTGDCRLLRNKEIRWISIHAHGEVNASGQPIRIIGTVLDITERKKTEQLLDEQQAQLIYSSKMAALGEMAAGIAHEINNPLTIINLNVGIIQSCIEQETVNRPMIADRTHKIFITIQRIVGIINGLRAFSHNANQDPYTVIPLQTLIDETLSLIGERIRNHQIELRLEMPPQELTLECRSVEISQILINLLNNAFDAVNDQTEKWINLSVAELEHHIEITVSDSGPGVPHELREKIMQPFFTTKPLGKGTGLGLSISKGMADAHQGRLYLASELHPTRFILELPKAQRIRSSATQA